MRPLGRAWAFVGGSLLVVGLIVGNVAGQPASPPVDASACGRSVETTTVALAVRPEPVRAGAMVTYCIYIGRALRFPGAGPRVVLHLPPGSGRASAGRTGYACTVRVDVSDRYQRAAHQDLECLSLIVRSGVGASVLIATAAAPTIAGRAEACAVAGVKADDYVTCRKLMIVP